MLVVETIGKIRRAYFVQGKPIKAICRELDADDTSETCEIAASMVLFL